jgi:cell division protease FtsH
VAFGGRVAEELVFGRISTGAANDIKQATELSRKMVRSWGMSEKLGPLSYDAGEEQIFLGREISQHRDYSEATAQRIDVEVTNLVTMAYNRAKAVLHENMDILHKLAELLLEKETVMGKELDDLIRSMRPDFEFPSGGDTEEPAQTRGERDAQARERREAGGDSPAGRTASDDARDEPAPDAEAGPRNATDRSDEEPDRDR